jgi:hypothetical protein
VSKKPKSKKTKWFVHVRGSYLPSSWQGWTSYVPFIAYLSFAEAASWHYTHNLDATVLIVVPNWIAAVIVMTWFAKRTS